MLIILLFSTMLLNIYCKDDKEDEKKDKKEEEGPSDCKNQYNIVELSPGDKEALKMSPKDSAIAKEFKQEHLVPVRIVTTYMRPNAEGPLCGVPQNVMLAFFKLKEQMSQTSTNGAYTLFKGEAAKLVGNEDDKKDECDEEDDEEEDDEEGDDEEGGEEGGAEK